MCQDLSVSQSGRTLLLDKRLIGSQTLRQLPLNYADRDFPGGPVVKNLTSNVGDMDLILGQGTKISYAAGQLSLCTTTTEPLR